MPIEAPLSLWDIALRLAIVLILVLANAFFVAAEFALVGARRTRIDALARVGHRRAQHAHTAIKRLDHYISGTQLGITLASLALGFVGERTVAAILMQAFGGLPPPWNLVASHGVAIVVAFLLIVFLHIVLGELAPKALALMFPETVSLWTAGPLIVFARLLGPFIAFLNGSAILFLRLAGLRAPSELERVHRPEEIEMLVTQSYEHGLLSEEPVDMIRGIFDLSETSAAEVMTPRTELVALPATASVDEAAELILDAGHSRIPVYGESLDQIVGVVFGRDVWRAQRDGVGTIAELIQPVPFVPDSKPIEGLLREMQAQQIHVAIVVDEFGGTAGIVTLEDLVEEIVGEIRDEHEAQPPEIEERPTGEILLAGTVAVSELNERYRLRLPEDDYTSVAGYILGRLGRVPRPGEDVAIPDGVFRVLEMEGRRVRRLALLFSPAPPPGPEADGE
jgi:CBS domain containing-hemolysin-like protein